MKTKIQQYKKNNFIKVVNENISKIAIVFLSFMAISCAKDDIQNTDRQSVVQTNAPVLLNPIANFNIVLDKTKETDLATSVIWNHAAYSGTTTVVNYVIEIAKAGTDFSVPVAVTTTTNRFKDITVGELNTAMILNLKLKPFLEHDIDIRIKSYVGLVGSEAVQYSNLFTIKVTPYPSWANWGILGDATKTGWGSDTNLDYDIDTGDYFIVMDLDSKGKYKFRLDDSWTNNFGDNGNDLSLDKSGADIPVPVTGTYKIVVNFKTKKYTITKV
jgi:starch-binding outer membrane protein SusE/F